jgi:ATP-dependent protease HslVU (ClpYQ) peptidase subunit
MTLLLGIADYNNGRSLVCADSAIWDGAHVDEMWGTKIIRCGAMVLAVAGACGAATVARAIEPIPQDTPERWVERFMEALGKRNDMSRKISEHALVTEWELVIASGDHVLSCGADGGLAETALRIVTAGRGSQLALGAAIALAQHKTQARALEIAQATMLLAAEYTDGCRLPVHWCATDGEQGIWRRQ